MKSSPHRLFLYLLFSLSGFCALIYEILWAKHLSLIFGTTMAAVSIVTATFMGGLAIGSYLVGRYADRDKNPLQLYALLEVGIAITALLFVPLANLMSLLHGGLHQLLPHNTFFSTTTHLLLSIPLLLPAAILMGGTFPVMCRLFNDNNLGSEIGRLYAINTLGATLGALSAGFLLIPTLGLAATGYLAIGTNLAVAAAATAMAGRLPDRLAEKVSQPAKVPPIESATPLELRRYRMLLLCTAGVGACSLAYEILWTRLLLPFIGNTTYAFSLILSAYLIGIALGGAVFARKIRPHVNLKKLFAVQIAAMGLSVLLTAPFYDELVHLFQLAHVVSGERWWHLSLLNFVIVFMVMCVPTLLSGSLLPAAVSIIAPARGNTGQGVGAVVLHNTVGAVLGSLVAGFVLLPNIGLLDSLQLIALLNVLLGFAFFLQYRGKTRLGNWFYAVPVAAFALVLVPDNWDAKLMNSGVYCYAPKFAQFGGINRCLAAERILEVIEGADTTVAIKENIQTGTRYFAVNGKTDGGNGQDMATQLLVGKIPLLLHPDPKDVLVIGLGTGITLAGAAAHPVNRLDCVEISPEVVKASAWFEKENRSVLSDPRVQLHIDDGRNMLALNAQRYDVIASQPSNPWQAGNANLFTADFYRLAAAKLKTGGVFSQWIGLYDITPDNLRIATNTFLEVFPEVLVFRVGPDLIMIGARHPLTFDYRSLGAKMDNPQVGNLLADLGLGTPACLLANHYFMDGDALRRFSQGAAINTDDLSALEFSFRDNLGAKIFGRLQMENTAALLQVIGQEANVPLVNLGVDDRQVVGSLRQLATSYGRANKKIEAGFFREKIGEFERRLNSSRLETLNHPFGG